MGKESCLELRHVKKFFCSNDSQKQVLTDLNLVVEQGEFIAIVGHSGCGKSTLLRLLAGLERPDAGEIVRQGVPVIGPSLDCSMMFQEPRLLPWLNVMDNLLLAVPEHQNSLEETKGNISSLLSKVGLAGIEEAYPDELSGGMAQRVALARSIINNPSLLLLDEPFSALDAMTRMLLQEEFAGFWRAEGETKLLVTHDIEEAVYLADRVLFLGDGYIKHELFIDLPRPRRRMSSELQQYRARVYQWFRFTDLG